MSTIDAQTIQLYASVIQSIAALVFLGSVVYEAHIRKKLREQRRRDRLIELITSIWFSDHSGGATVNKASEEFINAELLKRGEKWRFPFERI